MVGQQYTCSTKHTPTGELVQLSWLDTAIVSVDAYVSQV